MSPATNAGCDIESLTAALAAQAYKWAWGRAFFGNKSEKGNTGELNSAVIGDKKAARSSQNGLFLSQIAQQVHHSTKYTV